MKILAVVVTYNPDIIILQENLLSLEKQVEEILIVDNGSKNIEEIKKYKNKKILELNDNKGIAYALNKGLEYASQNNYTWMLTMDQDSKVHRSIISHYKKYFSNNIAQLTPKIVDLGEKRTEKESELEIEPVKQCITSGCLMNVEIAGKIGGFDNDLFIDYVDFDYSWKALSSGYDIIRVNPAILYHRLGEAKKIWFPGSRFLPRKLEDQLYTYNHSPLRTYYYNRNAVYVLNKYGYLNYRKWIGIILWDIKKILFEIEKYKKSKAIVKGIRDGLNAIKTGVL